MRLIWSSENVDSYRKFLNVLSAHKIAFTPEEVVEKDWGKHTYGNKLFKLWIHEEDQVDEAKELLKSFLENPEDKKFSSLASNELPKPPTEAPSIEEKKEKITREETETKFSLKPKTKLSNFLILLCSFILLLELWTSKEAQVPLSVRPSLLTTSSVEKALFFDYPKGYEYLDQIAGLYGYPALAKPADLPPPGKFLYEQYQKTPVWKGIYPYLIKFGENLAQHKHPEVVFQKAPLFEKVKDGEVYRLVSPILLHNDILHLFFNMIWLLLLGTQIEARIGALRYLVFIVIVAIISNVFQYLMSGPAFIGFSGVICGMALFIRSRQKEAPWEGYQMSKGTYHFILFLLACLQLLQALPTF